jgi:hypothetical protein
MGVFERRHHIDDRLGSERIRINDLEHDLRLYLLVRGNFGDEEIGTVTVAEFPEL